jgi:hypothetical protein
VVGLITDRSPIKEHVEVRRRKDGTPPGGLPDEAEEEDADEELGS